MKLKLDNNMLGKREDLFCFSHPGGGIYLFGDGEKELDCFYFSSLTNTLSKRTGLKGVTKFGSTECRSRMLLQKGKAVYVDDEDYEARVIYLK